MQGMQIYDLQGYDTALSKRSPKAVKTYSPKAGIFYRNRNMTPFPAELLEPPKISFDRMSEINAGLMPGLVTVTVFIYEISKDKAKSEEAFLPACNRMRVEQKAKTKTKKQNGAIRMRYIVPTF